jgi:glycosyltransferase involved in cell wall biosynthesis
MTLPGFSVLMSVYAKEQPEHLKAAVDSVFAQSLPPNELVLVKDGPLPAPLEAVIAQAVHRHRRLSVVTLERNVGLGAALNVGLRQCRNELVARMDSDDLCLPGRFERQIPPIASDPGLAVIGGWISEFEHDPQLTHSVRRVPEHHEQIAQLARTRCPINHPTVVFRKSAIQAVGGYNAKHLQEDYYLWARLMLAGRRFYNIQAPLVHMRTGGGLFDRRGGLRYAKAERRLFIDFYRMGFISLSQLVFNLAARTVVRLVPTALRKHLYVRFARARG